MGSPRARRLSPLFLAALVPAAVLVAPCARAKDPEPTALEREQRLTEQRHEAIRRGCEFLVTKQSSGGGVGDDKARVAFTALTALALMAGGSGVDRGPYGTQVRAEVDYLLNLVENPPSQKQKRYPDGYFTITNDLNSRMHGQGYAMLALASALSSAPATVSGPAEVSLPTRIRRVLARAVRCAEESQTATGGWGYDPTPGQDHEGSVTVTVAQGLRAAHDAGLRVSAEVVKHGLSYLRNSQKLDGSFKYSIQQDRSTYALTAAAVSSFFLLGDYGEGDDKRRITEGVRYLKKSLHHELRSREWFFYGNFYAAWAAWQEPPPEGRLRDDVAGAASARWWSEKASDEELDKTMLWGPWHVTVYPQLLDMQLSDGSWRDDLDKFQFGEVLSTAFAVLTLAIPDELVPIFQR